MCPTLCNPMDCSPPGSSVHGILQKRILEWVAVSFSRRSSWLRDQTCISWISRWVLYHWATREAPGVLLGLCNFKKPLETCIENNNLATKISMHLLICQGREGVQLWLDGIRRWEFSGEGQSTCVHLPLWTGPLGGSSKSVQRVTVRFHQWMKAFWALEVPHWHRHWHEHHSWDGPLSRLIVMWL